VTAARDGLVGRRHHAQQGVPDGILPGNLTGPLGEERAGAVMQQGWARQPQDARDEGVGLIARGPDGVAAPALAAQHPRREVEVPARQL